MKTTPALRDLSVMITWMDSWTSTSNSNLPHVDLNFEFAVSLWKSPKWKCFLNIEWLKSKRINFQSSKIWKNESWANDLKMWRKERVQHEFRPFIQPIIKRTIEKIYFQNFFFVIITGQLFVFSVPRRWLNLSVPRISLDFIENLNQSRSVLFIH